MLLALVELSQDDQKILERSLIRQAEYLSKNLEKELGGNHLLENYVALGMVALVLEHSHSSNWLAVAANGLKEELSKQLLSSGEHYERSPGYHVHILGNLLRFLILCQEHGLDLSASMAQVCQKMAHFLAEIVTNEGSTPLLGDSGIHELYSMQQISDLMELAGLEWSLKRESSVITTDYFCVRRIHSNDRTGMYLLYDIGEIGPESLPAHAHCDLLNVQVGVGESMWFTDSGNFDYEDSDARQFCRSSMAHNLLTVDGKNQCEIWSKFRMGERGKVICRKSGTKDQYRWCFAEHNAYRKLGC